MFNESWRGCERRYFWFNLWGACGQREDDRNLNLRYSGKYIKSGYVNRNMILGQKKPDKQQKKTPFCLFQLDLTLLLSQFTRSCPDCNLCNLRATIRSPSTAKRLDLELFDFQNLLCQSTSKMCSLFYISRLSNEINWIMISQLKAFQICHNINTS